MSDLIKRDDALKVIEKNQYRLRGSGLTYEVMLMQMEEVPSIKTDRPKGEWKKSKTHASMWVCSNCDWGYQDCYDFDFCPQCGADMRGEDDE